MGDNPIIYYENYSPVGDLLVLAICFVIIILLNSAYISKTRNYNIFRAMIGLLMIAGWTGVLYHVSLNSIDSFSIPVIYVFRTVYHTSLFGIMFLYVLYAMIPLRLDKSSDKRYVIVAASGYGIMFLYEVFGSVFRFGFYIDSTDNSIHEGHNIFGAGYIFFVGILIFMLIRYRARLVKPIRLAIIGTYLVAVIMMAVQGVYHQTSFTTATFLFPTIALLYLIHANPFDIEIGAVNVMAFEDMIRDSYNHKRELLLMSLFMHDFEGTGRKYPKDIQETIRHFYSDFFKGAVLFQITSGRMILAVDISKNPAYENSINHMLMGFEDTYPKYKKDFKITIAKTVDSVSQDNDYVGLIKYVESHMKENDVHFIEENDVKEYFEHKYILTQLEDINAKKDLDDTRVEVYCQPVFNIMTGKYDTAEALMRLNLEKLGMVYPDKFIRVAEENNYIHTLSMIILHKTCMHIKSMLDCMYFVKRISVNFSVSEVRDENFCKDINDIIESSGIPYEKIAVEITESQNDDDFIMMKDRINELREHGVKFYLDDFGTGYSNFERIMELPFDIIKFDRSLVLACGTDYKAQKMVYHLARMFSDMNYSVLYEGVETAEDEEKCKNMCARYLQGYKYSKPIPISRLTEYFEKESA